MSAGAQRGRRASLRRGPVLRVQRARVARQEEVHPVPHGVPDRDPQRGGAHGGAASVLDADYMQ